MAGFTHYDGCVVFNDAVVLAAHDFGTGAVFLRCRCISVQSGLSGSPQPGWFLFFVLEWLPDIAFFGCFGAINDFGNVRPFLGHLVCISGKCNRFRTI